MGNGKIKAMTPMPAQNPGVMTFGRAKLRRHGNRSWTNRINKKKENHIRFSLSSGGRDRTSGLWVMSPTSYHCSTPRCGS